MHRQLCFGDNLGMLRLMPPGRVQLCCTDPPFNSGRNYNMFLGADAQKTAFTDIWDWDDAAIETHADIQRQIGNRDLTPDVQKNYADVARFLDGFAMTHNNPTRGPMAKLRSYLTFMAPRIVEIRRVLTDTGSFYLHCDSSASHYLKTLCDVVFGVDNFRNEIVWHYAHMSATKRHFPRKHDTLFRYTKSNDWVFNADAVRIPYADSSLNRVKYKGSGFAKNAEGSWIHKKGKIPDTVWDLPILKGGERLGYPTQKPRKLYERIIEASSNPGDIVLDPFCGCGTTIDAAETNDRGWIGIDITVLALEPIQRRMRERHMLEPFIDYNIHGYPCNMQEVTVMLSEGRNSSRYKDFEQWAVTRLGMSPTNYVGDGGIDGDTTMMVWSPDEMQTSDIKAVCEVKSGAINVGMVRGFRMSMRDNAATAGVLIGLSDISAGIKEEMRKEGTFTHNSREYPRLQYWQITEAYFKNPRIIDAVLELPWRVEPSKRLELHVPENQQSLLAAMLA